MRLRSLAFHLHDRNVLRTGIGGGSQPSVHALLSLDRPIQRQVSNDLTLSCVFHSVVLDPRFLSLCKTVSRLNSSACKALFYAYRLSDVAKAMSPLCVINQFVGAFCT